jgi:NADH dehydrogenase
MKLQNVLVIGGSGFVGRHVVRRLAGRGIDVTVPSRRRERTRDLLLLPTMNVVTADVHDPASLANLMRGQDAVINLVGVLQGGQGQPYGKGFARAHVDLPRNIIAAARQLGVKRVLHMSALKAAPDAPSAYLRSKADGEIAILAAQPDIAVTLFRPSVIFGDGDAFLTLFADLQKIVPFLLLGRPDAHFQPVWVGDVAASIADSLGNIESIGKTYSLCGPRRYSLRELVALAGSYAGHRRPIIGLPDGLARLQAMAMEFVPGIPLSRDSHDSMQVANTCEAGCTLPFGRIPIPLENIAPGYLGEDMKLASNDEFRRRAGR